MRKFLLSAGLALLIFLGGLIYFYCTVGSDYTADLLLRAAHRCEQHGLDQPAQTLYRLALRFNKYSSEALFSLADLYERQQLLPQSERTLVEGLLHFPSNPRLYLKLASFYVRHGNVSTAIKLLDNAPAGYVRMNLSGKRPSLQVFPAAGRFSGSVEITLRSEADATLFYTTDGSEPTTTSTPYQSPILLPEGNYQLRVIAVNDQGIPSVMESRQYEVTPRAQPTFSPGRWIFCSCCGRWNKVAT